MDYFRKMAQNSTTDFSVFKTRRSKKTEEPESSVKNVSVPMLTLKETEEKGNPVAEPEMEKAQEMILSVPELDKSKKTVSTPQKPELDKSVSVPEENEEKGKVIQFKKPENLNEEATIKLEAELETAKSNLLPVFPIVRYLKNKCLSDETFAVLVMDERKKLSKCFSYVTDEVKKALNSQNGWLDDNEVYAYAETYYLTDEAVFEQIAAEKAEAEKKRQEEVAKKRKEQEEKRKKADAKKKKKETEEKKKEPIAETKVPEQTQRPEIQEQLCLKM